MSSPSRDLLSDLTPDQRAAVEHGEGPLLILAGAGSGKTRVITRRVAHLLQCGVKPWSILAITFTNKAAGEMKQRVDALAPGNKVWISTFHSLGARLLRQYADKLNIDRNFTIYDVDDRNRLVKDALDRSGIDNVKFTPERLAGAISKAKNALQTPKQYEQQARDFFTQTTARVYTLYEKALRTANGMDFDDLLYLPALALKLNEELRAELDARFKYVLIDEYQDTNQAQYEIARRLSLHHPNLCVVGDPDQCLLPGTLVQTPTGPKRIEDIRDGDVVLSAVGDGRVEARRTDKVMANPYRGNVFRITVEGGHSFAATPNHHCFARLTPQQKMHHGQFSAPDGAEWGLRKYRMMPGYTFFTRDQILNPDPATQQYRMALASVAEAAEFEPGFQFLRANPRFACLKAETLLVGMTVPVAQDGGVAERQIESIVREDYTGPVYDLSIPETRNFIANGVVVHNSIYKWRGSDIRNILDFERDFPAARVITLEQNYRSTKTILHAASTLIDHNKQRKKKTLVTANPAGDPVRVLTFDNGLDEAEGVVLRIKQAVDAGRFRYRDHAIFLRINALTRSLESAFVKHGVPFQIVKGLAFFERKENKDILAYLRLLLNPADTVCFLRAVNEPARGIGKVSLERLVNWANEHEMTLTAACGNVARIPEIKGKAAAGLREFFRLMTELRAKIDLPPHEIIREVLDKSGYRKMLAETGDEDDADRLANIEEMITAAKQFHDEDSSRTLADFLEQITLASDVDSYNEKADSVSVMTLHAAKGLEFPAVYMLACEQGILPHNRSIESGKDEELEEERRLCFVGMTRAMKELFLCHARMREFRGQITYQIPSMFLDELPPDVERQDIAGGKNTARAAIDEWRSGYRSAGGGQWGGRGLPPVKPTIPTGDGTDFAVGQVVQHDEYGIGQITDVSGFGALRRVKVRFPAAGEKTFVADKVKMRVVKRGG